MRISEIVDKVIVMNLERRTDRLKHCKEQAKKFDFNFTRISSIDGLAIKTIPNNIKAGEYGLYLTYMKVLDYAIQKNLNTVLIMEDDFQFEDDLEDRLEEIKHVPNDWDLIYLGANHYYLGAGDIPPQTVNQSVMKLKSSFCAHSIIFTRSMLIEFKKQLEKTILVPDMILKNIQPEFNCYGFKNNICKQYDSYSDIINTNPYYNSKGVFD
jgi:hypothetical protein